MSIVKHTQDCKIHLADPTQGLTTRDCNCGALAKEKRKSPIRKQQEAARRLYLREKRAHEAAAVQAENDRRYREWYDSHSKAWHLGNRIYQWAWNTWRRLA